MSRPPKKIAILGGGVGAVTAAFALTSAKGWEQEYDVTVYQIGWRLGGKGASGRRASAHQRIEEHGLHVWSGFYDNAIKQMKECLDELNSSGIGGVYGSFGESFTAHNNIALGDYSDHAWTMLPLRPENNDAIPGTGGVTLTPWQYFTELAGYLRAVLDKAGGKLKHAPHPAVTLPAHVQEHLARRRGFAVDTDSGTAVHWLDDLAQSLPKDPSAHVPADTEALEHITRAAHRAVKRDGIAIEAKSHGDETSRLLYEVLDLGGAALRGMVADGVYLHGFDVIDDVEISAWLERHGSKRETIDGPLVRAVYDYAFGFRQGMTDHAHRAIGAGVFLNGSLRLFFTYKGSIFFKMNAGMGDTIFTPYYKVLAARGVKFEFFHKVRDLKLDLEGVHIETIEIDRQATVLTPPYNPFVNVKGLDCWPSEPDFDQLKEGKDLAARKIDLESSWSDWQPVQQISLERGKDFDEVVLGISLGALPYIAGDLIDADPAWREMIERVKTTATQAMQLWLKPDTAKLGWPHGDTILTAYADDMNTWADMTHLAGVEDWPEGQAPGSIAYFCGPLPDPADIPLFSDTGFPERARAQVRSNSRKWMDMHGAQLWPTAFGDDGKFDTKALVEMEYGPSDDPWDMQYFRANFEPAERYVLSTPGSTTARLRSDRSGFANLWLAGDWTYTGINAGCVEAATMSGLRAAAGLRKERPSIVGEEVNPVPGGSGHRPEKEVPMAPVLKTIRAQNSAWPWSSVYGMAQTTGASVVVPFAREIVQKLLPKGLVLGKQTITETGDHPVILLFARQRDVRPNQLPFGMNYSEFICAVPWVRHADPSLQDLPPLIVPTKLYLDSLPPILLGIYGYGFPKERASMHVDMDNYIIRDAETDEEIISCSFERAGAKTRAHALPFFAKVRAGYEMAMVTRNRIGQWQYSVYDFSLGQAELEPLNMQIRISSDVFGLPKGIIKTPDIRTSSLGGFFLTSDATINNPLQSHQLLRTLKT